MGVVDQAKQISNEAAQLADQLEAGDTGGIVDTPQPVNYSSSVTSCQVDPATGEISLSVTLYPGGNGIEPVPDQDEGQDVPSAPIEDTPQPGNETTSQVVVDQAAQNEPPPGFQPSE